MGKSYTLDSTPSAPQIDSACGGNFPVRHCNCRLRSNHHNFGHFPVFRRKFIRQCTCCALPHCHTATLLPHSCHTASPVVDKSATLCQVLPVIARQDDPHTFCPRFVSHFLWNEKIKYKRSLVDWSLSWYHHHQSWIFVFKGLWILVSSKYLHIFSILVLGQRWWLRLWPTSQFWLFRFQNMTEANIQDHTISPINLEQNTSDSIFGHSELAPLGALYLTPLWWCYVCLRYAWKSYGIFWEIFSK